MKKSLLLAISLLALAALPAQAVPRTFVASYGKDGNPGSLASPCRTFAGALALTDMDGEIIVLDSAGYGPVTIGKSVSIIAQPSVWAGVSVTSGSAITVSAGLVTLRGLTISGTGGGTFHGIHCTAGELHVEGCVINGFAPNSGSGIYFTSTFQLFVKDTILRGNTIGIWVNSGKALVDQSRMEGNNTGLVVWGGKASVRHSVASGNDYHGFQCTTEGELNLEDCLSANNGAAGLNSYGTTRVSNCTVTDNFYGLYCGANLLESRGNNTVRGNTGGDTFGQITPIGGH